MKTRLQKNCLLIAIICLGLIAVALLYACAEPQRIGKTHVVKVPLLQVVFLGEGETFIGGDKDKNGNWILGQAWEGPNLIFVPGTIGKDGKLIYRMDVLGEELGHVLNGIDPMVSDPHDIGGGILP